ncbi:uncharacterized protein BT62DRAFT_104863 [Guyanagaster necrorhizus]|uniref:F-box domain-containing protein n=1 Tax=Guyanagaster necrorhizus TaxID=856835 RepID=A0A9P7VT64_9AGAR|nr:uncharacterized protein BT62DRAFT_104863 [Guyanagaster necrorhizus MCA 3950]KAG7446230.1 hypothetical protein BT62DRAFT_104863 [Guyanagaster necrorhizus MCA 3950]
MTKHRLSPASLPPSKRLHGINSDSSHPSSTPKLTFETALYDELILCIFSHLSWVDLCATQSTSKTWCRLAADNELWRILYLRVYGRPRLRGARGFFGRADGREVRSLPDRAKIEDLKDWKWMFRISSNWRTGRCLVEQFSDSPVFPSLTRLESNFSHDERTHLLLAGSLTIIASSRESLTPEIHVRAPSGVTHTLLCRSSRSTAPNRITALSLDQSSPVSGRVHLAAFLSSGEFTIYHIHHTHLVGSIAKLTYVPTTQTTRTCPIVQSVYHHPLLISLSQDFALSIYDLSGDTVTHTQTLTSFTSFPPTSLVLSTPSLSTYRLVVAYAIPVYPAHWSVGATEVVISGHTSRISRSSALALDTEPMTVVSTRTTRSFDIPSGWIDERKVRSIREQWSRKVSFIADTQTDGKWVVLAPAGGLSNSTSLSPNNHPFTAPYIASPMHSPTTLQLYRLSLPPMSSVASSPPKLTFARNLHGQIGPVSSLALADGRCVSLGLNGSVWVWDLEAGTSAKVCDPESSPPVCGKRTLVFDERRVISSGPEGIVVRRFDV